MAATHLHLNHKSRIRIPLCMKEDIDFSKISIARYRAWFETLDTLHIADYPGSTWRGALGHALKVTVCVRPNPPKAPCTHCPQRTGCLYPPLFDTEIEGSPPRPFVIEPQTLVGYFFPGSVIGLDFVLFGATNHALPVLVETLHYLGQRGLGAQRARLALAGIEQQLGAAENEWAPIHQPQGGAGIAALPPVPLLPPAAPRRARLDLITPLKIKTEGKPVRPDTFTAMDFLVALKKRFEACAKFLEELSLMPPEQEWLAHADSLIKDRKLMQQETHHYSTRQREVIKLDGLVGYLIFQGPLLAKLWPWLWLGQWLHLGSSTTSGLGRYVLRTP
jgi:hypothetical protein